MIYNIIGDIHGRDNWIYLVKEDAINIFVGDYFSPYDNISFEECRQNFLEIIQYKLEHPDNVILLIGNHDEDHWHIREGYSRFDSHHWSLIRDLFEECQKIKEDIFQVAYSIENKALVTHAGVSYVWYERYKNHTLSWVAHNCNYDDPDTLTNPFPPFDQIPVENPMKFSHCKTPEEAYNEWINKTYKEWVEENKKPKDGEFLLWHNTLWRYNKELEKFEEYNITPDEVAEFVNKLWLEDKKYSAFNFRNNCGPSDYYGDDERHGPMWIRPDALKNSNIFLYKNYWQFFGHTQRLVYNEYGTLNDKQLNNLLIDRKNKLVYCDCQSYAPISLLYNSKTNEIKLNIK